MNALAKNRKKRSAFAEKMQALVRYSGNPPHCRCCGLSNVHVLDLDHPFNNGAQDRREKTGHSAGGPIFYRALRRRGWPFGYRVLCSNCNQERRRNGFCHHEKENPIYLGAVDLFSVIVNQRLLAWVREGIQKHPETIANLLSLIENAPVPPLGHEVASAAALNTVWEILFAEVFLYFQARRFEETTLRLISDIQLATTDGVDGALDLQSKMPWAN